MSSSTQVRASRFGPPPDTELPPPVPIPATPVPPAREWIPKQPFMSSLPPPSTRLPGAPPPPILPPNLFNAPRDPLVHSRLPPRQDKNISSTPESQPNQLPPQEKYSPEPPLPTQQEKDVPPPPSFQTQGHHEQAPLKTSERVLRPTGGDGLKENTGEERHLFTHLKSVDRKFLRRQYRHLGTVLVMQRQRHFRHQHRSPSYYLQVCPQNLSQHSETLTCHNRHLCVVGIRLEVGVVSSRYRYRMKAIAIAQDGVQHHEREEEKRTERRTDGARHLNIGGRHFWLACHRAMQMERRWWREGAGRCRGKGRGRGSIMVFRLKYS